jgi:hypothetical protein
MPLPRPTSRRPGPVPAVAVAALLGVVAVSAPARDARADEVSPDGKGIVGGALLGAEVITITEALAGARPPWAYVVGAIVGAGGGGVAGHFIENGSSDGKVPMYMLAGGLALIIPAVVLTLNATRWQPEEGATEDNVPTGPAGARCSSRVLRRRAEAVRNAARRDRVPDAHAAYDVLISVPKR